MTKLISGREIVALILAFGFLLGACGGQVLPEGTCSRDTGNLFGGQLYAVDVPSNWFCTASPAEAGVAAANTGAVDVDASASGTGKGEVRVLPQCQPGVAAGGSCPQEQSVDTTNTTLPAHVTVPAPDCFDCSGGGTGTEWTCGSGGWEAAAVYSCR